MFKLGHLVETIVLIGQDLYARMWKRRCKKNFEQPQLYQKQTLIPSVMKSAMCAGQLRARKPICCHEDRSAQLYSTAEQTD